MMNVSRLTLVTGHRRWPRNLASLTTVPVTPENRSGQDIRNGAGRYPDGAAQRRGMPQAKDVHDGAGGSPARPARHALTSEQEATWFAYMRVVLRLNYEINRELQVDSDLSHQDFHVLNALADSPGQRLQLTDLAIRIGWERSRVSHQVLRMESRGLVERRPSGTDARATDAALTAHGQEALQQATPGHAALVKQMFFDGLDPDLLTPLHEALDQIHGQIIARGTLPRPSGRQSRWTTTGQD
jgi:DNA-binding MarR family transcriptional regulator